MSACWHHPPVGMIPGPDGGCPKAGVQSILSGPYVHRPSRTGSASRNAAIRSISLTCCPLLICRSAHLSRSPGLSVDGLRQTAKMVRPEWPTRLRLLGLASSSTAIRLSEIFTAWPGQKRGRRFIARRSSRGVNDTAIGALANHQGAGSPRMTGWIIAFRPPLLPI